MGLNANSGNNKTFVSIAGGYLTTRVSEGTAGAVARQLTKGKNEGQTVYELKFKSLTGVISKIEYLTKEFGSFIEVTVTDGEDYTLQIAWEDFGVRDSFIKRLPNIDPEKEVEFTAWKNNEGHTVFLIKQDGEICKMAFTRDNPNGMPEATKNKLGKWDFSKAEEFLFGVLEQEKDKFDGKFVVNKAKDMFCASETNEVVINTDTDIPF